MIVVFGGIKGGSGKSTLAMNICVMRSQSGKKVLLVDGDDQKSTTEWMKGRYKNKIPTSWTTVQLSDEGVAAEIRKMKRDYDDVIVDVGGRDTRSQRAALFVADAVVIPFQPRSIDLWTINPLQQTIIEAMDHNPNLKVYAIINRADSVGKDNLAAINMLINYPFLQVLPFVITQKKSYPAAHTEGVGIIELKVKDHKAIEELTLLYKTIYQNDIKNRSE